jgi:hypothetical protein
VQHDGAAGRRRPVGPDRVERIVVDRDEARARRSAGLGEALGALDAVQPRCIAELGAGRQVGLDPGRRRVVDEMRDGEDFLVDFLAHLHLIAPVDEDHGAVGEHDGCAGRAGEAGEPGEPLVGRRHVFVLEPVGARHHETVEPAALELGAQRRNARGGVAAPDAILERLEMRFEHAAQSRA